MSAAEAKSQNLASAKILNSSGSAQITRRMADGENHVKVRAGDELFAGDVLKTGAFGRVVIGLVDGSQAIVGENTTVEIKNINNSPRTIFNVLRGKTRIKIEKLGGKPNPYRITTPTTVIAVRGTIFDVFVKDDETKVFVVEGKVSIANLLLPEQEIILTPGQFTRVQREYPPHPPKPFKPGRNDEGFKPIAEQRRRGKTFGDPSTDNPGRSGNAPGQNPSATPGNPGNAGGGRRKH